MQSLYANSEGSDQTARILNESLSLYKSIVYMLIRNTLLNVYAGRTVVTQDKRYFSEALHHDR